jgi:integrase
VVRHPASHGQSRLFFTPGVPFEFKQMVREQIMPRLKALAGEETDTELRRFYTFGVSESALSDMLDAAPWPAGIELGYRSSMPLIELKLIGHGASTADMDAAEARLLAAIAPWLVGRGNEAPASQILALLGERSLHLQEGESRGALLTMCHGHPALTAGFSHTLNDLLDEYMSIYGVNTWAMSTYESRRGLARNYITPIIGDMLLSDITPRMMDKYYRDLLSVKTVSVNNRKPTSEYLTPHTVREIHKLLRSAFNQAVRWELISRNPVLNATLPKEEHKERDIWTAETLSKAMEVCDDPILSLALNLAFSCSLRIGEMLGLTWDCIDIAPQSIENGSAYIFVNKELQRVTRGALDDLSDKGVIKKFPPCIASTHTALVLKEPKTKTSIRRVYLPKTVAYMLVERKKEIDELMDLFGDEYIDNNLVFCSSNGRPMESQVINRAFNKLIKENGLPHVVFHSLRHSSITYKLKLNGGDMKSVQGDSGHAQVKMVADVYSHIIDEDRCINAQRLEEAFYSSKTPDPVEDTEPKTADTAVTESDESDAAKILELLKNPETAALLKQLAKAL